MNTDNIMAIYEDVNDNLKFITTSSVRTKIILSLKDGDKSLNELKNGLQLKPSSILHALKKLEEEDIVFKKDKNYSLSAVGRLYAVKSESLFMSFNVVKNCEKVWLNHLIEGIPYSLIQKIGCLNNSEIIESTPTDIIRPHTHYNEILSKSKNIKIVSPIFYYPFFDTYITGLKKESTAQIIITPMIMDAMIKNIELEKLIESVNSKDLKFMLLDEDIKVAFAVTEKFLHLGLFLSDGLYDATISLVNYDRAAIRWGEELYQHYLNKAKEINLDDMMNSTL